MFQKYKAGSVLRNETQGCEYLYLHIESVPTCMGVAMNTHKMEKHVPVRRWRREDKEVKPSLSKRRLGPNGYKR